MAGYSDLTVYESDEERHAVCAELARMLRIVPLTLSPVAAAVPCRAYSLAAAAGESSSEQGVSE